MDTNSFTPEQLAAWRRGEFVIEFSFDEPPQVNQQDFERWVQERKIKPNLNNYSDWNCLWDYPGTPTWEVKPLEAFPKVEDLWIKIIKTGFQPNHNHAAQTAVIAISAGEVDIDLFRRFILRGLHITHTLETFLIGNIQQ
jgi:hypothetical protein